MNDNPGPNQNQPKPSKLTAEADAISVFPFSHPTDHNEKPKRDALSFISKLLK